MKNYVQTPKQRRVEMAKQKQRIQASKPVIQFQQLVNYRTKPYSGFTNVFNKVHYINGKR